MARRKKYRKSTKWFKYLKTIVVIMALAFLTAWLEHMNAETFEDTPYVIDGDSLAFGELRVRLVGIDAPELKQECRSNGKTYACGAKARAYLQSMIGKSDKVACRSEGNDKYGRTLAECSAGAINLNAEMILAGWAVSYGGYGWQETKARFEKRGLWAGDFDRPKDWRFIHGELSDIGNGALWRGWWRRLQNYIQGIGSGV